jgi:hypothetical protein
VPVSGVRPSSANPRHECISFSDRGSRELKGVPGEWRLFAVDQVEAPPSSRVVPDTRERLSFTSS